MVWFGLVWFGLVWFGLVWFGLVWFGLVWFGFITSLIEKCCNKIISSLEGFEPPTFRLTADYSYH